MVNLLLAATTEGRTIGRHRIPYSMTEGEPTKVLEAELSLAPSARIALSIAIAELPSSMTEREPTKVPGMEMPVAPSTTRNEGSYPIEKIGGANGKGLADAKELSVPVTNLLIGEMERLIAELERLAEENHQLKQLKNKYHYLDKSLAVVDVEKRLSVLKEKVKPARANDLLATACLIAGSVGLGAAPNFVSLNSLYEWYLFVIISAMLVLVGIANIFHRTLGR
ncbi:MAG: hypothetical protein WAK55_33085 [Xanthobacteraceae bacterium]